MLDSIVCVGACASRGRAQQLKKGSPALPTLIITSEQLKSASIEHDIYVHGPLRSPPGPRTVWIKEASRMESSLGPEAGKWRDFKRREWIPTYSYNITITIM